MRTSHVMLLSLLLPGLALTAGGRLSGEEVAGLTRLTGLTALSGVARGAGTAAVAAAVSPAVTTQRPGPGPVPTTGDYDVSVDVAESAGRTTWTYTVGRTAAGRAADLGRFVLNLTSCGDKGPTLDNVVSATVNGEDWMSRLDASAGRSSCAIASDSLLAFTDLPQADKLIIRFTLDGIYPPMDAPVWLTGGGTCVSKPVQGPGCAGYTRTTMMSASASLVGALYGGVNTYMRTFGFDFTEHPNCSGGYGGHLDGVHGTVDLDPALNRHVFRFDVHIDPVIDGDRCSSSTVDRQRNEMKSITNNSTWAKVQGNWDEWQILEWKFKLPAGYQPTQNFTHIHQLKAQDGPNNGSAVITFTPRASSSGANRRMQIIHSVDGASTGKGTIVDNVPLSEFEGEWVQVREEVHYAHDGYYACRITRIRDGRVLIDFKDDHIDMWRTGSSYIRSKFGIYRSLAGGRLDQVPVGQSRLLRNESLWVDDIRIYERNTNPTPGVPHD